MPKPELSLSVQYGCKDERLPTRPQLRRWVSAAQEKPLQATVRFVGAAEGRALNRDFRGKDCATNVLSFVYENAATATGDLVVC
ncbi:MAG: rRNA maturation RNAse YbeY, partial [Rhodocyclaceae bacterium]|nr:rRNA maturation RNAse YbeY [Rhodocyclaceae bacterium]